MRARKVAKRSGEALLLVVAGLAAAVTGIVLGEVVVTGEMPKVQTVIGSTPGTVAARPTAQPAPEATSTTEAEPQIAARTATSATPPTTPGRIDDRGNYNKRFGEHDRYGRSPRPW